MQKVFATFRSFILDAGAFAVSFLGSTDLTAARALLNIGNVDDTSDANKPVSTAQAAAVAGKVSKSGDTMTGALSIGANAFTCGAIAASSPYTKQRLTGTGHVIMRWPTQYSGTTDVGIDSTGGRLEVGITGFAPFNTVINATTLVLGNGGSVFTIVGQDYGQALTLAPNGTIRSNAGLILKNMANDADTSLFCRSVITANTTGGVSVENNSSALNLVNGFGWLCLRSLSGGPGIKLQTSLGAADLVTIATNGSITFTGGQNFAPITKSALLLLTPNAATGGRWRVTDATPASREAYPDGTNWRYSSDDVVVT